MSVPPHPAKEPLIREYPGQASPGFGKNEAQIDVDAMRSRDLRIKRRIRVFRLIQRILSTILSLLIAGTMIYALVKYYTTKNHNAHGTSIWARPTMLWPTFMLLAVSLVTVVLNIFTICAYFRGVEKANTTSSVASYIGYVLLAVHVLVWAVSMGLFKMANTGKDLWGYSCGSQADAIQEEVQSFVDFGKLCTTQTGAFYTTIIQAVIYVLTFVIYVWSMQRMMAKKKLEKLARLEAGHGDISTTY